MAKKIDADTIVGAWQIHTELLINHGIDLDNRSFCINDSIEQKTFEVVDSKLSMLERTNERGDYLPITIKLNSHGGDPYAAWAIVSRIKTSPCKITIEAHGVVASAATMILAAGHKRRVSRYCTIMFHESSLDDVSGKLSDVKTTINALSQEERMYIEFLARASKKTSKFWANIIESKRDVYMRPHQLLKLGIVDEVF